MGAVLTVEIVGELVGQGTETVPRSSVRHLSGRPRLSSSSLTMAVDVIIVIAVVVVAVEVCQVRVRVAGG